MKLFSKIFLLFSIFISFIFFGCKKEVVHQRIEIEVPAKSGDHKWFYFSEMGFSEIDLPQHSPIHSLKPWTESVRVCDANTSSDGRAVLLVNHLGILIYDSEGNPNLLQDYQMFSSSTASNLVFEGNDPYFTLSKNSFFNQNMNQSENQPFLVRADDKNSIFYPAVTAGDLNISENSEVTGTIYDGEKFISSIKTTKNSSTSFEYIEWKSDKSLGSLQPQTKEGKIQISKINKTSYRQLNTPADFSKAPDRLKLLLAGIKKDFEFSVSLYDVGGASPRFYSRGKDAFSSSANAIISDGWIAAVFSDGTTYFCGANEGRPVLNNGKTIAFRLPKLPENYLYGPFAISGDFMVVGWEENDFYKTGRTGFLLVDMGKLFYKK